MRFGFASSKILPSNDFRINSFSTAFLSHPFQLHSNRFSLELIILYRPRGLVGFRALYVSFEIFSNHIQENFINLIEVGITNCENLQTVELEKSRQYELLARELGLIHKCKINVIPYVMTSDELVTKYHSKYRREFDIDNRIIAYIQSKVIKKIESISFEYRQGLEEGGSTIADVTSILKRISSHNVGTKTKD
ncbi:hypothetical protein NAPIS_ORF00910 [Vairimorpha apis BRL 01]|uniref:Uncharacterized protein n=1 Tax=Vairimorpha apis BRL 01 TaxID=1037528 RepID=T0L1Y4_9MICR|nr:hypothetical protein NAPIS_ORF00910 [Vairimorpha apis BRL 01]